MLASIRYKNHMILHPGKKGNRNFRELAGRYWFVCAATLAALYRVLHLTGPIDEPHAWRQCDTAYMALDFYQRGIDLLHPAVCWMGGHKTLVLEFPLHEACVALAYHLFGPRLPVARLITLAFFLGAAAFLYLIVKYLQGIALARMTTLIFLMAPLSLFYSRAMHIDFSAVFFSHAMLYCLMRGIDEEKVGWTVAGSAAGILAFLIKAPYAFFLFLPLAWHVIVQSKYRFTLKMAPALVLPLICFALWRHHAHEVNSRAPDWFFIRDYKKFIDMGWWYFGTLGQRFDAHQWAVIIERLFRECCTVVGSVFFVAGLFLRPRPERPTTFFKLWLAGLIIYLLIFFNPNYGHNYYQIPFLSITSFFIAAGIQSVVNLRAVARVPKRQWLVLGALVLVFANAIWTSERRYYWIDPIRTEAGRIIAQRTDPDALIIAAVPQTSPQDPTLLYRARRAGWSVRPEIVTPELIDKLVDAGASNLVVIGNSSTLPAFGPFLDDALQDEYDLEEKDWRIRIYRLANRSPAVGE